MAALTLTTATIAAVVMTWRNRERGLVIWCSALAIAWGLPATLLLPWIDAAKSYRAMYLEIQRTLPLDMNCMTSRGLGESERAMLDYVLHIQTNREDALPKAVCNVLLAQSTQDEVPMRVSGMSLL